MSGLYLAHQLEQLGHKVTVLEARDRAGGRILSEKIDADQNANVDLGPAWVWPQLQPRLSRLLDELNIEVFEQFTAGDMLYQQHDGTVQRYSGQSAHVQSYRIVGGAQLLVNELVNNLRKTTIELDTIVKSINAKTKIITAEKHNDVIEISADRVITAIPLRLLAESVQIQPDLEPNIISEWQSIPTWMAGHCKIMFSYDAPFWREQGLSGEVFSHRGPLSEIYDGTPFSENALSLGCVLTSFIGINAFQRRQLSQSQLIDACLSQLENLFGTQARKVKQVIVKDWSDEIFTTTESDLAGPHLHPHYEASMPRQFFDAYLSIAGTEAATEYGGYIEGALESADAVLTIFS